MINKKKIIKFQIFCIFFESILGIILHFLFNWSNYNLFIGSFSAVNESTWEHLKLIFFPMLITIIISYFFLNQKSNYLCSKTIGIIISILFTVTFFYTYTGILGFNSAILNILLFFTSIILGEYVTFKLFTFNFSCNKILFLTLLLVILLCFITFTYITPHLGIFKDPITNSYGVLFIHYSYNISFVVIYLVHLLMLLQIFGNEQLLFLLKILTDQLHPDYLYIN